MPGSAIGLGPSASALTLCPGPAGTDSVVFQILPQALFFFSDDLSDPTVHGHDPADDSAGKRGIDRADGTVMNIPAETAEFPRRVKIIHPEVGIAGEDPRIDPSVMGDEGIQIPETIPGGRGAFHFFMEIVEEVAAPEAAVWREGHSVFARPAAENAGFRRCPKIGDRNMACLPAESEEEPAKVRQFRAQPGKGVPAPGPVVGEGNLGVPNAPFDDVPDRGGQVGDGLRRENAVGEELDSRTVQQPLEGSGNNREAPLFPALILGPPVKAQEDCEPILIEKSESVIVEKAAVGRDGISDIFSLPPVFRLDGMHSASDRVPGQERLPAVKKDRRFLLETGEEEIDGFFDCGRIEKKAVFFLIAVAAGKIALSRQDEGETGKHVRRIINSSSLSGYKLFPRISGGPRTGIHCFLKGFPCDWRIVLETLVFANIS